MIESRANERDHAPFLAGGGEMGALMRAHDWAATPIGPPEGWPQMLQTLTALILSSSQPMFIVWGAELTTLYNDAYIEILAGKHPALGEPFDGIWQEIWDTDLKSIVARAFANEALHMSDIALVLMRRGYPEEAHFSFSYTPVRDAECAVQGFFCACLETTEQVLEQRRARVRADLTERLRSLRDPADVAHEAAELLGRHLGAEQAAYGEIDATGEYGVISRDWNDGSMASNAGRHRLEDFGPAMIADLEAGRNVAIDDVRGDPRTASPEALATFASRGIRAFLSIPYRRGGRLAAVLAVHAREPRRWHPADVALAEEVAERVCVAIERARTEAALRESEARFRQFGDASSDALWIRDAETLEWEYLSAAFATIYGMDPHQAVASRSVATLLDVIVPEDRERTLDAIGRLREGPGEYEYRIQRPSDGQVRWLRTTGFRLLDADGRARRLGGITRDVTEARQAADRMGVLVDELQHRTRNIIAVIRAMATRTRRTSASLDAFGASFAARLDALARANGLLSQLQGGDRVAFDELLQTELRAHGIAVPDDEMRVTLSGPAGVRLRSASVQTLALALHELLTNAMKHGALNRPDGRIAIAWRIVDLGEEPSLRIEWRESWTAPAGSGPGASAGIGFGRELIERAIPFQLGAQTSYDLGPGGLGCVITLPLSVRSAKR